MSYPLTFDQRRTESTPLLSPNSQPSDSLPLDLHATLSSSPTGSSLSNTQIDHVTDYQDFTQEKTQNIFQRVWSNMSGFSKGLSICTLSLYFWGYMIGFALGWIPETPKQESVTVVGQAEILPSRRELDRFQSVEGPSIPDFVTERPIRADQGYFVPQFEYIQTRSVEDQKRAEALACRFELEQKIETLSKSLAALATGSGKMQDDFLQAIQRGDPLESMGLRYYVVFEGKNEIPKKNQKTIEVLYQEALTAKEKSKEHAKSSEKIKREILQNYSATDAFTSMVTKGIPYQLTINGARISQFDLPAAKMLDANIQLATWSGLGEIQLSDQDPAIVAQQYLVRLAESIPFTVDERELGPDYTLETSGRHSVSVVSGNPREIQSRREVQLKDKGGQVIKTYQWNETIRIFPEQGNRVEITRDVREIN